MTGEVANSLDGGGEPPLRLDMDNSHGTAALTVILNLSLVLLLRNLADPLRQLQRLQLLRKVLCQCPEEFAVLFARLGHTSWSMASSHIAASRISTTTEEEVLPPKRLTGSKSCGRLCSNASLRPRQCFTLQMIQPARLIRTEDSHRPQLEGPSVLMRHSLPGFYCGRRAVARR